MQYAINWLSPCNPLVIPLYTIRYSHARRWLTGIAHFHSSLEPGFYPAPAYSRPVHHRSAPFFAHRLAIRPLPPAKAIGVQPKPQGIRQDFPVDALGPLWQDGAAMTESESEFSLTRTAS